jgi:pyruvate kinase
MDLAGPKIRVGPLSKTTYPLKITVRKDLYGQPIRYKKGLISSNTAMTKLCTASIYDFVISISANDRMGNLDEGDYLSFIDVRNKKRRFSIVEVVSSGLVVSLDKTAYITENTILRNANHQVTLQVINLEQTTVETQVKKADILRIFLDDNFKAHHTAEIGMPGISVSLPEAFLNIK